MINLPSRIHDELDLDSECPLILHGGKPNGLLTGVIASNDHPTYILNFGRSPEFNDRTRNLHENIELICEQLTGSLLEGTTPEPIALFSFDGLLISVQSSLPGDPGVDFLRGLRKRKRVRELVSRSVEWMIQFHETWGVQVREDPPPPGYDDLNEIKTVRGPMHRDFVASNILLPGDGYPCVIDWEDFTENGFPIVDLFHLIAECAPGSSLPERLQSALLTEGWYGKFVRHELEEYAEATGIHISSVRNNVKLFITNLIYMAEGRGNDKKAEKLRNFPVDADSLIF